MKTLGSQVLSKTLVARSSWSFNPLQSFSAVIPLTDPSHTLLPLHFSTDPGADFAWNRDEFDSHVVSSLQMHPNAQVSLLNKYLEIVKVALPAEWYGNVSSSSDDRESRSRPTSSKSQHRSSSTSVAKQFGSIGKKLKKNLGRLARNGSFREPSATRQRERGAGEHQSNQRSSSRNRANKIDKIVRNYVLGAFMHTGHTLPYQNEMVQNYLEV
jgi:hypothetical protein